MVRQVLGTEFLKLRHSAVPWITLAAFSLGPLGVALFLWIAADPRRAHGLGLIGAKAGLLGLSPTWPDFLAMFAEIVGGLGLLLLAFIVAYLFGREYQEGTAKTMLTSPAPRPFFVLAKFAVAAAWWALILVAACIEAAAIGLALSLSGFTAGLALSTLWRTLSLAGIAFLLSSLVGWVAVLGKGYLAPLGFALATLALGNLFAHTGWARWFPWSIPMLLSGSLGGRPGTLPPGGLAILCVTFAVGVVATALQLRLGDNTQ